MRMPEGGMGPLLTMSALSEVQACISNFWSAQHLASASARVHACVRAPASLPCSLDAACPPQQLPQLPQHLLPQHPLLPVHC